MIPDSVKPYIYYEEKDIVLLHGDCLEILPLLEPDSVDLVLTDPPYGIGINKSNRLSVSRGFGADTWDDKPIKQGLIDIAIDCGKQACIWGGNYYTLKPNRGFLIWDKDNAGRDFADCEQAWTNFDMVARIFKKRPMNMDGGKVHPTQKPIELMKWCIQFANEPQTILDPFLGSGTTAVAAKQLGRKCIGIELEQKYLDIAVERLRQEVLF